MRRTAPMVFVASGVLAVLLGLGALEVVVAWGLSEPNYRCRAMIWLDQAALPAFLNEPVSRGMRAACGLIDSKLCDPHDPRCQY